MKLLCPTARPLLFIILFSVSSWTPSAKAHQLGLQDEHGQMFPREWQNTRGCTETRPHALEYVLRLDMNQMRGAAFLGRLRGRWTLLRRGNCNDLLGPRGGKLDNGGSSATLPAVGDSRRSLRFLTCIAWKGLDIVSSLRRGSTAVLAILVAAAYILTVTATGRIAACSVRWDRGRCVNEIPKMCASRVTASSDRLRRSISAPKSLEKAMWQLRRIRRRRGRLGSTRGLPLAYASWWQAVKDRRRRVSTLYVDRRAVARRCELRRR